MAFNPNDMLLVLGEQTMQLRLAQSELAEVQQVAAELTAKNEELELRNTDLELQVEHLTRTSPKKRGTKR